MDIFLAGDANFRNVRCAHGYVATAATNHYASVSGHGFRCDVQVEGVCVARHFNGKLAADGTPANIDSHDATHENNHADDQHDFATGDASGTRIAGTAGDCAIVELDQAEEDECEGPPAQQHLA